MSIQLITRTSVVLLLSALLLNGCRDKSVEEITYTANVPVYLDSDLLKTSIVNLEPQELTNPGKIHIRGEQLFIVDLFKGVHIFDNSNPSSPQNMGYINIPGVVDIASRGDVLYADSYQDLVAINISNPSKVSVLDREEGVFLQILPPTNNEYPMAEIDPNLGVVVGWKVEVITEKREIDQWAPSMGWRDDVMTASGFDMESNFGSGKTLSVPILANGQSGSMARFIAVDEYLYTVSGNDIQVFDLSNHNDPVIGSKFNVGRVVETLFPMDGNLFVGTTTGMVVYSLAAPSLPTYLSNFNHSNSCDPVVVENDVAYITLRSGNNCGGWLNQLDVVDVSNISEPQLIASYEMVNPHGLGISNDVLFICDGSDGLKVYDATDKTSIDQNRIAHFPGIQAYDVIPLQEVLLMIGADGFYQYDYSDLSNIQLLSVIAIGSN